MKKQLFFMFVTLLLTNTIHAADTASGVLDATSPRYDRIFTGIFSAGCDAASTDSGNDGVSYQVFEFYSPGGQVADIEVTAADFDSVLSIYCDFDPLSPAANLAAYDDDGGVDLLSAITPADNLVLDADISYYAVIAGFDSEEYGDFTLELGGDLVFVSSVPPTVASVPTLGEWGTIILGSLLLGLGLLQRRRFSN